MSNINLINFLKDKNLSNDDINEIISMIQKEANFPNSFFFEGDSGEEMLILNQRLNEYIKSMITDKLEGAATYESLNLEESDLLCIDRVEFFKRIQKEDAYLSNLVANVKMHSVVINKDTINIRRRFISEDKITSQKMTISDIMNII